MLDRGLILTQRAVLRQLRAMPHDLFLIRLIHHTTRRPFPGERLWTASQLSSVATLRFLRIRNREGCDVYLQPYTENRNAGYILLDLDATDAMVVDRMRAQGHEPCVVLQTSPGHLQAWLHVSRTPLEPALATAVSRQLAGTYGGDGASADWRHLGRLAGFTNQKPQRRTPGGHAPWVQIVHARAGLAPRADALLQVATAASIAPPRAPPAIPCDTAWQPSAALPTIAPAEAVQIYQSWMRKWRIAERFPQPNWSIVDLWIARQLLSQGTPAAQVQTILKLGSPYFPRCHGNPEDYLCRTLARAAFPGPARPVCVPQGSRKTAQGGFLPEAPPGKSEGSQAHK